MVSSLRKPRFALPIRFASSIAGFGNTEPLSSREQKGEDGHDQDKGLVLGSFFVKLCTAKLCLENQNKTYRDQSYPKAFPQIHKRESNFPCSLAQITPDNKQRFNTHSVSLARA